MLVIVNDAARKFTFAGCFNGMRVVYAKNPGIVVIMQGQIVTDAVRDKGRLGHRPSLDFPPIAILTIDPRAMQTKDVVQSVVFIH